MALQRRERRHMQAASGCCVPDIALVKIRAHKHRNYASLASECSPHRVCWQRGKPPRRRPSSCCGIRWSPRSSPTSPGFF